MVLPCVPCAVAAAPAIGAPLATLFGVGATAVATRRILKSKKTIKKKSKKKKPKKSQKGGSIKKNEKQIHKDFWNCFSDCYKERDIKFKKPYGISSYEWMKTLSPEEKKKYKDLQKKSTKCSRTCKDIEKRQMKKHKLKYSKEYRVINKALKQDCCKCHYVKKGNRLKKVKGPFSHCSYDMTNCCKDKKTIVKSKK